MLVYNVEVDGRLVWLQWTPDYHKAQKEMDAWCCLASITGRCYKVVLQVAVLG